MKVEIGKTYLTEGGRKATVKQRNSQNILVAEIEGKGQSLGFNDHGVFLGDRFYYPNYDLVSEYKDETQPTPIAVREWGNISFDGKEETLDTSFSIMPHDMKIIGGYRIENVGSTPIYVSSERHKIEEKDDTPMFKVGDRVRHTETSPEEIGTIEEVKSNNRYLVNWGNESAFGFSTDSFENLVRANEQIVIKEKFVGEQPSSPVQSRKTIVEGEYGKIYVTPDEKGSVMIGMVSDFEAIHKRFNAEELRDMIRVLGEVADYLEEVKYDV